MLIFALSFTLFFALNCAQSIASELIDNASLRKSQTVARSTKIAGSQSKVPQSEQRKAYLKTVQSEKSEQAARMISAPRNLIRVPLTRQATDYTCGVGALQSVLAFYGIEEREDDLARFLKSDPQKGTAYQNIEKYSEQRGFTVKTLKNMNLAELKTYIDSRKPVICLLQAWAEKPTNYGKDWDDGHYVVAVGYDKKHIFLMDPSTLGNYAYVTESDFLKRWHDTDGKEKLEHFGMVISDGIEVFAPDLCRPME